MLAATEANSLAGASGKGIFLQRAYSLYKPQKCCINTGCDRKFYYASTLQDGCVGFDLSFDTMLIGFSLDHSAFPKLSCSTDRTYKCLGSQLWVSPRRLSR